MKKVQLLLAICLCATYAHAQWSLTGNSITSGNFLGSTNNLDILFKRNSVQSGLLNTSNTSWGVQALNPSTTGTGENVAVGVAALALNSSGSGNTAIGFNTSYSTTTGYLNTATGANALLYNTTGYQNVANGVNALSQNVAGYNNVAVGVNALQQSGATSGGLYNTGIGYLAGATNTTGNDNIFLGTSSGGNNTTGSLNTFLGTYAGAGITTGSGNTIIGYVTGLTAGLTNTVILGDGNQDNRLYIDNNGHAGFGGFTPTSLPTATLEVKGPSNASGLQFANLTSANTPAANPGAALSLDASGNVILVSGTVINAGTNTTVTGTGSTASPYVISAPNAGLWTTSSIGTNNIINANTGGIIIGTDVTSTPTGYSLYVGEGILAERVKVALPSGSNWADYVFNKNYKLLSLDSVESYVNTNKHLPNVPSAEELVKDGGIDVNVMFAKQMEKTEELTLYIIQQNKKIEELEKKVDKLEKRKDDKNSSRQ